MTTKWSAWITENTQQPLHYWVWTDNILLFLQISAARIGAINHYIYGLQQRCSGLKRSLQSNTDMGFQSYGNLDFRFFQLLHTTLPYRPRTEHLVDNQLMMAFKTKIRISNQMTHHMSHITYTILYTTVKYVRILEVCLRAMVIWVAINLLFTYQHYSCQIKNFVTI
jgi:hypothetical protein